jgi:hypothetical protein
MGILVLVFAINASSAPTSPFTSYTEFGHQSGDLGPGVFQGTVNDVWDIPGLLFARNAIGVGSAPAVPLAEIHIKKSDAGMNTGILVENTAGTGVAGATVSLDSSTSLTGRSYLELITAGGYWIVGSIGNILEPKLVIARNGSVWGPAVLLRGRGRGCGSSGAGYLME